MFLEQNVLFGKSLKISRVLIGLEDGGATWYNCGHHKTIVFKQVKNTLWQIGTLQVDIKLNVLFGKIQRQFMKKKNQTPV